MNWEAIKHIYYRVLIYNDKIELLGGNKYKLISFYSTGEKYCEVEYQNGLRCGKDTGWYESGSKGCEAEYKNGHLHGKSIAWYENGNKIYRAEYQNGNRIK